jgi:hypothetical protein
LTTGTGTLKASIVHELSCVREKVPDFIVSLSDWMQTVLGTVQPGKAAFCR